MGNKTPRRYDGFAQVRLMHHEALVPSESPAGAVKSFRLGEANSDIHITDYRQQALGAAPPLFDLTSDNRPTPAYLVIRQMPGFLDVQLFEAPPKESAPVFWLGFLDPHKQPAGRMQWQALKLVERRQGYQVAYIALGE